MRLVDVVLFAHIAVVISMFAVAAVLLTAPAACVLIVGVAGTLGAGVGASAARHSRALPGWRTSSARGGHTVTATTEPR